MSAWRRRAGLVAGLSILVSALLGPGVASAAQSAPTGDAVRLTADLDGAPIELARVGQYYCHDFAYPRIHCFSQPSRLEAAVGPILAASSINYVAVFDYTSYQGPYMYVSQNYTVLALIGWNDRISSFIGLNSQKGRFWTDWFYSGSYWNFCCNVNVPTLGSMNDSISSVYTYT